MTPPPPAACFAAFDVTAGGAELADLLQTLTTAARFLTAGGRPPEGGAECPPATAAPWGRWSPPTA